MLLRRITKHVKDQNWFAVGIDFVIVVIGVFIGIQVANWNDARTTEQDAKEARASLIADLQNDRDVYAVRRKFYLEVKEASVAVEAALDSKLPQSMDQKWQLIYDTVNAASTWPFKPSGQVYDQLLNSGKLGLVSDMRIQRQMRDYYQDAAAEAGVTFKFDSDFRYASRKLIDWELHDYHALGCGNIIGSDPSEIIEDSARYFVVCNTPDLPAEISRTAARLHTSEPLHDDLRLHLSQLDTLLYFIEYLDDEAKTLIEELEGQ